MTPDSLKCYAGTASASTTSQQSAPAQSASASTAQQIQATGPAAVAAVKVMQAAAVGASIPIEKQSSAGANTHPQTDSTEPQALEDEPPAGTGDHPMPPLKIASQKV